jgi:beta-phosphoglucomutase-like phosphatase (HAD superfamily)
VPSKASGMTGAMVVEVIGPLLDDRGALAAALGKILTGAGVDLRPGAVAQVAGGDLEWAISTVLEGHGREDLSGSTPELVRRVIDTWRHMAAGDEIRLAPGAGNAWRALLESGRPILLLSILPAPLVGELGRRFKLAALEQMMVRSDGPHSAPPRPGALATALAGQGASPGEATAAVPAPAATQAAVGAGCGEVVQVGLPTGVGDTMPVDRFVGTLGEV